MNVPITSGADRLPASVREVAEVIGFDATMRLIELLPRVRPKCHPGGRVRIYVPRGMADDHRMVQIIGREAADRLARVFGGEEICLAVCAATQRAKRNAEIRRMVAEGATPTTIAAHFRISARQAQNVVREIADVSRAGETADDAVGHSARESA